MKKKKPERITTRLAKVAATISAIVTIAMVIPAATRLVSERVAFSKWFSMSPQVIISDECS